MKFCLQEGYVVFKTEIRGNFFATCDFIQFTYKVDKHGYKFKNALIPDIQVAVKGGVLDEPEDVTFQVKILKLLCLNQIGIYLS